PASKSCDSAIDATLLDTPAIWPNGWSRAARSAAVRSFGLTTTSARRSSSQPTRSPFAISRINRKRLYAVWFRLPLRRSWDGNGQVAKCESSGAGAGGLAVAASLEMPVALELRTSRTAIESACNLIPSHAVVALHVI